jgi:hypothetical protein
VGLLLGLVLKSGVSQRFAKPVLYAVLLALAVAAFFGAKAIYDHNLVSSHDAKQEAKATKATLKRERAANADEDRGEQHDEEQAAQLETEVQNAIQTHPVEARRSSGPASNAALGELRGRQSAAGKRQHKAGR